MIVLALVPSLSPGLPGSAPLQDRAREQEGPGSAQHAYQLPDGFVQFARVPEGGQYPRLGTGPGEQALLYYKGGEEQGDLYLTRTSDEAKSFAPGVRVNPAPGTVACLEGSHGGSIDLGSDGSAHVLWTTSGEKRSILYARVPSGGEPAQPIDLGAPPGLCLSTAVTVDGRGRVFVFYLAASDPGELQAVPPRRQVWVRTSDDGLEFSEPARIDEEVRGVSEHSALAAHVDEVMGTIFLLYRTAYAPKPEVVSLSRGMRLLSSSDGDVYDPSWVDNWKSVRDPRSSAWLGQEEKSTLAVWDSGGDVFWTVIRRQLKKANLPIQPKREGPPVTRTCPAGAAGGGEVLLAWLERPKDVPASATRLAWCVWLREGRARLDSGFAPEPPQAGRPVVLARAAGGFTVLY